MHKKLTLRKLTYLALGFSQVLAACGSGGDDQAAPPPSPAPPAPAPPSTGLLGWQLTTSNIGLAPHGLACDSLPQYQGSGEPASGTVIRQMRVTVPLDLSNGNILIEKSCIRPSSVGSHHAYLVTTTICNGNGCQATSVGNVVIRDSEIDAWGAILILSGRTTSMMAGGEESKAA
jgi:hypothetical protein